MRVSTFTGAAVTFPRVQMHQNLRTGRLAVSATAAPADQKIRIKLKSYWVDLLQDSVEKIKEAATTTGATIAGPVPLPTRYDVIFREVLCFLLSLSLPPF